MVIQTTQLCRQAQEDPRGFIHDSYRAYQDQILATAAALRDHSDDTPVILLAGASGSGKTTTAMLLARELTRLGHPTHTLSIDNYFAPLTPEEIELVRQNKMDLETPARVDAAFLNEQLCAILEGEEVRLPRYDFSLSNRVFDLGAFRRKPGELVIMEGIHALNPSVARVGSTAGIYVSVRTRVQASGGAVLHPSKIRLMRRMLRDYIFRGRSMADTAAMAASVDQGENRYIMPFKNRAAYQIDTFIPYELSIYKPRLSGPLQELAAQFPELQLALEILEELPEIPAERVPTDSLIREFIGGGEFSY